MSIAEKIALLAFISQTPVLQSCLYELNLMPEQLKRGSKQWDSMLTLAFHFREGLQQQSQKITELEDTERNLTLHVESSRRAHASCALEAEARAESLQNQLDDARTIISAAADKTARLNELESQLAAAQEVLRELVTLKDMRNQAQRAMENDTVSRVDMADYEKRKPLAWAAARKAIAAKESHV